MTKIRLGLVITTDGMSVRGEDTATNQVVFEGGSLRDATEAIEYMVMQAQFENGVGNFNPDKTISPMVTNPDIRLKMNKIIDEAKKG